MIQKYSLSYLGVNSVEEYQTIENWEQLNSSIIMKNTTTVNDLTVYETITYDHSPDITTQKTLSVTAGKGQNVYILQFYSNPELFDKYLPLFNKIVSTIQIQ